MSIISRTLLVVAALLPACANAQDVAGPGQDAVERTRPTPVTIGVVAVYVPDYEGSNDYRFAPAPAAVGSLGGFNFSVVGNRASLDLIPDHSVSGWDVQAGPYVVVNLNRRSTKGIDDPRIKALGKIGTGIEVGGYVGLGKTGVITSAYDKLSVSLSYRRDVNGASKGSVWTPTINYLTPLSRKSLVALFVSADHASDRYADTYFGVTPAGARASGLPAYNPGKGWKSYTVGTAGALSLSGDLLQGWKLVVGGAYSRELNDFGKSPIVSIAGKRSQWLGAAGLAYTF